MTGTGGRPKDAPKPPLTRHDPETVHRAWSRFLKQDARNQKRHQKFDEWVAAGRKGKPPR